MLGVKYSTRTMQPCPRCHALEKYLKNIIIDSARTLEETMNVINV